MKYKKDMKSDNALSILGFGCMRFPRNLGRIDMDKTERLILKAYESGINYFDTAYLYMGSEEALGEILHKHDIRKDVYVATKLPIMQCKRYEDFDRFFQIQLDHLKTDYIDYFFMHALSDMDTWQRLCDLGIEKWIAEKKDSGAIKQIGFSYHGQAKAFATLLDCFEWDFVQIQYNYANVHYQAGEAGLKYAAEKGLPVFIMEPLLGGKLATGLPKKAADLMQQEKSDQSPAAWAFKWLWNQKAVTVVLSGMNDFSQLEENIQTAEQSEPGMLTDAEYRVYDKVLEIFEESYKIPCTGCNYCMPCPQNINIPAVFSAYNMSYAVGKFSGIQQYITSTGMMSKSTKASATDCVHCGQCEKHCPQTIKISDEMTTVKKRMEPLWFRGIVGIAQSVMNR